MSFLHYLATGDHYLPARKRGQFEEVPRHYEWLAVALGVFIPAVVLAVAILA